jgi:hypothetical protein
MKMTVIYSSRSKRRCWRMVLSSLMKVSWILGCTEEWVDLITMISVTRSKMGMVLDSDGEIGDWAAQRSG